MKTINTLTLVSVPLLLCSTAFSQIEGVLSIANASGDKAGDCSQAVAFIDSPDLVDSASGKRIKMTLKDRSFMPGVLPVQVGTTVEFPNEDVILHNVFSLSKSNKFDLGLYRKGEGKSYEFKSPGLVKVFCNIHGDMVGHVLVLDHQYFSRVGKDCRFKMNAPSDGEYKLSVWYLMGKGSSETIKVTNGKSSGIAISVTQKRTRLRKHKNKHGKTYKKSY